ncbi:TetR/AcrR family transcriptional regulator, partial [Lacrimispora sp.]|uniref:TetR/AcrR family transcriptional regulator n=1 Tax=Lacrimispora sp. TaxID=2719234 RepID=UPI00289E504D
HYLNFARNPKVDELFTIYELKTELLDFAYKYYEQFVTNYNNSISVRAYLILPLSYIEFAQKETHLFKLLFINDMDLEMTKANDFYKEIDNEKKAKLFSETIGVELEQSKIIFLDLFLYTHGIAVLAATKKLTLDRDKAEKMVTNTLTAFIRQEKQDWNLSV